MFGGSTETDDKKLEKELSDKTNKFVDEIDKSKKKANEGTQAVETYAHNTPKERLDPRVNANQAKGEGQYGMINGRDFSRTLRLARDADRYNNKPVDHHIRQGSAFNSGTQDMGVGYERPRIQTMETRAMDQAFQLDTNQKQLAQQLQAAVNRKDLDAFIACYQQMYDIELDRYRAENLMRQYERQTEMQNIVMHNTDWFKREFSAQTAATLMSINKENPQLAALTAAVLLGQTTPAQEEQLRQEVRQEAYAKYREMGYDKNVSMNLANRELQEADNKLFASEKKAEKKGSRWWNQNKYAKEYEDMLKAGGK